MKNRLYITWVLVIVLFSCDNNDDVALFDKTADERVAEAIANLQAQLVAPANGWRVKYRPEPEYGSFYVLMDFDEDNKVTIKSDLGNNDGEFFEQTMTYRIDSSLGLELIIESYSFFSFLLEQDRATFGAEYEFHFVNETPDDALVFYSKTDLGNPTVLLFEEAAATDVNLLATTVSTNLNIMADDFEKLTPSLNLTFTNKDVVLYITLDNVARIVSINSASRKTNTSITQNLNFSSPYLLKGDSIAFDNRFSGTGLTSGVTIKGIRFSDLEEETLNVCSDPIIVHSYDGVTSANDAVKLQTTLLDAGGRSFTTLSDFYFSPLSFILKDRVPMDAEISRDVAGALEMHLYYNYDIGDPEPFYAIGFVIRNVDQSVTFALRQFTPVLTDNNLVFNFEPDISIFGEQQTDADVEKINIYLDALTEGDKTYVYKLIDNRFEFHNPCTGWSFVFVNANQ
jgi:hypothetical protein